MEDVLYLSDLTDAEWTFLEPLVPPQKPGGRPPSWTRRAILENMKPMPTVYSHRPSQTESAVKRKNGLKVL
jgi:transposase